MICNTQAIVLNQHKYGDSSLICNLFTTDFGKVSIIAKGARSLKNPNSAILQPLNYIELIYIYKSKRNIQILKEASLIQKYFNMDTNYLKMTYSLTIIDIINKLSFHNNPCNIIFRLTYKTLKKIDTAKEDNIILYYIFFQLQLLIYLGYQPSFFNCYNCNKNLTLGFFCKKVGQLLCSVCSKYKKKPINEDILIIIKTLMKTHINNIDFHIKHKYLNLIQDLLFLFILYHLPELRTSKVFLRTQHHESK